MQQPRIVLDRSTGLPLAVQVAAALRSPTVRTGDRLSSTRELATALGVSRTVTVASYDQLLAEGWLVAPPAVRDRLLAVRTATATRPSRAGQRVVAAMAAHGDLSRHLRRLTRELFVRRELVRDTVIAAGHRTVGDAAGAHLVVPLVDRTDEAALRAAALEQDVVVDGLARHTLRPESPDAPAGLVIGWAGPDRAALTRGLAVLGEALHAVSPG